MTTKTTKTRTVRLCICEVGQRFGTCAQVVTTRGHAPLHTTGIRPYGFTQAALADARAWAEAHGYTVVDDEATP
jgi:hypothetical protein